MKTTTEIAKEIQEMCQNGTSESNIIQALEDWTKPLVHYKDTTVGLWCVDREPFNLLSEFFGHKSDANKYLDADEQEDLQTDFHDWLLCGDMFQLDFDE